MFSQPILTHNLLLEEHLAGGNLTASQAVDILDLFNEAVYQSTPNVQSDPYACNMNGLAKLHCEAPKKKTLALSNGDTVIRAATVAGVFSPALWATGGKSLSADEAARFYTSSDFGEMAALGLNAAVLPVSLSKLDRDEKLLKDTIKMAQAAGLDAIVRLEPDGTTKHAGKLVTKAAKFALKHDVLALELFDMKHIDDARDESKKLPLLVPVSAGSLKDVELEDPYVFTSFSMDHASTVADVASSTSLDDRMKLFYHESVSCIKRSPIEYSACYKNTPMFVSSGFDLAVDDCVWKDIKGTTFEDFGQCNRFDETIGSSWWEHHRRSFAARQLFAFEQGLGWTFASWKLFDDNSLAMDRPAKLLSLKAVAAAGLFPKLGSDIAKACLNPPESDFVLGDETLSPTPAPPPDCGNGWWNYTTKDCTYWIPPQTPAPSPCPSCECSSSSSSSFVELETESLSRGSATTVNGNPVWTMAAPFLLGAVVAVAVTTLVQRRRRHGYHSIPTSSSSSSTY